MTEQATPAANPVQTPNNAAEGALAANQSGEAQPAAPAPKPSAEDSGQLLFEAAKDGAQQGEAGKESQSGEKPKEESGSEQPIEYKDFTLPEGHEWDDKTKSEFTEFAKNNNLTQEQAQSVLNEHYKRLNEPLEAYNQMRAEWRKEITNNPVFGGKNLESAKGAINDCIRNFATNDAHLERMRESLVMLGLGDNPAFFEFMYNVAQKTKDDVAAGGGGSAEQKKPVEQILWPNLK